MAGNFRGGVAGVGPRRAVSGSGEAERFGAAMHTLNVGWEGLITDGEQVVTERKSLSVAPGIVKFIDHILDEITSGVEIHDWFWGGERSPSRVLNVALRNWSWGRSVDPVTIRHIKTSPRVRGGLRWW